MRLYSYSFRARGEFRGRMLEGIAYNVDLTLSVRAILFIRVGSASNSDNMIFKSDG